MKNIGLVCLWIVILSLLITACTTPQPASPTGAPADDSSALDAKALLTDRCTVCHDLSRVEKPHTAAEWKSIVERMIGKGAVLSDAEKEAVIQYLSDTYAK